MRTISTLITRALVVAASLAAILVPAAAQAHPAAKTKRVSVKSNGKEVDGQDCLNHSISANGNLVAFTCAGAMVGSDHNGLDDVYVKNIASGKIVRASVKSDGSEIGASSGLPSLSANGRYRAGPPGSASPPPVTS